MSRKVHYESTERLAEIVQGIVEVWYEPGRHDRSKKWIYTHKVQPLLRISERTFNNLLKVKLKEDRKL